MVADVPLRAQPNAERPVEYLRLIRRHVRMFKCVSAVQILLSRFTFYCVVSESP